MAQRLIGQETEYGLSVLRKSGASGESERVAGELIRLATMVPHLPALRSSGIFLANGSRFYVDCGAHPELATPECTNPWDVVRYIRAGEQLLLDLAERMKRHDPRIARAMIFKGNVDYTTRATWGCHESYLHRIRDRAFLSRQIIPHLVSRIAFTGAGGFDCFSPGLDFMVSPRVAHLHKPVSGESTNGRGIFHTKEEPLCGDGYHRLHILCGESLCSDTAAWLKVATTALVVALIEGGKRPGDSVELADPVAAMRTFAGDPSCSRVVLLTNGREATALEIQSHFLAVAEAHAGAEFMPPWAGEVCLRWRAMFDRLKQIPASTARTLDWAIKLALFENHARRRDTTLQALAKWTPILRKMAGVLAEQGNETPLSAELILSRRSPFVSARKDLAPLLEENQLQWDCLADLFKVRLELFEIDTRFGLLGEGGVFTALDAAKGALDHRFPGVDNVPHARENPPSAGRAAIRGACIRRVCGQNGRFAAEWDGIWDLREGRELKLADPFCMSEKWARTKEPREAPNTVRLFREGCYADVLDLVEAMPGLRGNDEDAALSHARLGDPASALAALESVRGNMDELQYVALQIWIHSSGWVPAIDHLETLFPRAERLMERTDVTRGYSEFVVQCYKAVVCMHQGLHQQAEALFASLIGDPSNAAHSRMYARTQCFLAELHRRQGRDEAAMELVAAAAQTHGSENLLGDSATHSLPLQAKLARDDAEAGFFLHQAESIHRMQRNNLGLAHVLCLRARRHRDTCLRREIERLEAMVPVLQDCKVACRIRREWDAWIAPESGRAPVDYWGL